VNHDHCSNVSIKAVMEIEPDQQEPDLSALAEPEPESNIKCNKKVKRIKNERPTGK
jgi:hypothetical protein